MENKKYWNPKPLTGIPSIDAYNRSGAIMDAYYGGKIDKADAIMWGRELKATRVLEILLEEKIRKTIRLIN